jgi:hypothetical protein
MHGRREDHRWVEDARALRAAHDATTVERLQAAGVVILGKTNLDEFAMGSSPSTRPFIARPWDLARVPGGSSRLGRRGGRRARGGLVRQRHHGSIHSPLRSAASSA